MLSSLCADYSYRWEAVMACFETAVRTAPMIGENATSASAKWVVMLRNFTFPVIWWAFMWCSFQFHEILGHPGASGNGAALGNVLTIFIAMNSFHYLSGINMQPSSGLMLCQYACVQPLWNRTAYFKVRHFLQSMRIDFLLAVDIKKDKE